MWGQSAVELQTKVREDFTITEGSAYELFHIEDTIKTHNAKCVK